MRVRSSSLALVHCHQPLDPTRGGGDAADEAALPVILTSYVALVGSHPLQVATDLPHLSAWTRWGRWAMPTGGTSLMRERVLAVVLAMCASWVTGHVMLMELAQVGVSLVAGGYLHVPGLRYSCWQRCWRWRWTRLTST